MLVLRNDDSGMLARYLAELSIEHCERSGRYGTVPRYSMPSQPVMIGTITVSKYSYTNGNFYLTLQ